MELIDRYVAEVGRHLPYRQRADIEAELRSLLVDNLEARAQGETTREDVISLLQEFGPPQKIAASYWPEGQYLIGPTLYPLFRMVAGIALTVVVIVQLVLLGVGLTFRPEAFTIRDFAGNFVPTLISAFGSVVLAFAVMQWFGVRPDVDEERWDPTSLPPVQEQQTASRVSTVIEIALGLVLVVLLSVLPGQLPQVLPPNVYLYISPVLLQYLPLLVLSIALGIGLNVILLWRGKWETGTQLAKIGLNLFGIAILALLISGHNAWLVERNAAGFLSGIERLPQEGQLSDEAVKILSMQVFRMAFIIALISSAVDTVQIGWRLVKQLLSRSGASSYSSGASPAS